MATMRDPNAAVPVCFHNVTHIASIKVAPIPPFLFTVKYHLEKHSANVIWPIASMNCDVQSCMNMTYQKL
jgi:hypothetical protein